MISCRFILIFLVVSKKKRNFGGKLYKIIGDKIMAIAIKTIPVLTGDVAERFIEIAESSRNTATTVIPEGAQDAIRRMMERSKNVKIKLPL